MLAKVGVFLPDLSALLNCLCEPDPPNSDQVALEADPGLPSVLQDPSVSLGEDGLDIGGRDGKVWRGGEEGEKSGDWLACVLKVEMVVVEEKEGCRLMRVGWKLGSGNSSRCRVWIW